MVYTVGPSAGHLKKNHFEFKLGSETLSVPKIEFFSADVEEWVAETGTNPTVLRRAYIIGLFTACDPEVGKKVEAARLSRDQLNDLYEAWGAASKVDEGKSSRSANS